MMQATPKPKKTFGKVYSDREKEKIIQLFDFELQSRLQEFKSMLEANLESLAMYSNNQITRLPPHVRSVTLREFGEKYNGEINNLVRGMAQVQLLRSNPVQPSVGKRKRFEGSDDPDEQESKKGKLGSPTKSKPSSSHQRTASSSSRQFASRPPQLAGPSSSSYTTTTFPSSSSSHSQPHEPHPNSSSNAQTDTHPNPHPSSSRPAFPHTASTFSPKVTQTLPVYPPPPRPMRPDEIILSENGSPVANPLSRSGNGAPFFSFGFNPSATSTGATKTAGGGTGTGTGGVVRSASGTSIHSSASGMTLLEQGIGIGARDRDRDRDSSATSGTRSSTLTAVNSIRDSGSTAVFGSGLMLQVKTANGSFVAFDPLQTMPEDLDARDDLGKTDKKAIADAMAQFAASMQSWGNFATTTATHK